MKHNGNIVLWTLSGDYDVNKPVLVDAGNTNRFVSLGTARRLVASLAGAFDPGSTVCLHLPNDVLYPLLVLAILGSRARWTGTNVAYTVAELKHHFRISETRYVVTAPDHLENVRKAVDHCGQKVEIILFADLLDPSTDVNAADSCRTILDLLQPTSGDDLADSLRAIDLDDTAALMNTSGTTGLPKMAARSHKSLWVEQLAMAAGAPKAYEVRRLYCVPIFHAFAAPEMIFNALRHGHRSYFMHRFDDSFVQKVHDFKITETSGAPPLMLRMVNDVGRHHLLQSLRRITFGGAILVPELRRQTLAIFKEPPRIVPVYGMTEGGWFTTLFGPEDDEGAEAGSVGRPIPGYTIKVVKNTTLADGTMAGEIMVRGPQVMQEYLNNSAATATAFENGWLKTGDFGYIQNNHIFLVDRVKDLIKVSGFQVAPAELEEALRQFPAVVDASVFGAGHDIDEYPVACVVVSNPEVSAEQLKAHLRKLLTGYKVSRCDIRFVNNIPRSTAGKVIKKALRLQVLGPEA
ncbi:AMP-dependent synthetase and ligase [Piedraia hortae CBS 480.64]|uniref:AMP-dependent synthetase and ligase n=1 Tax=Piedraia hortae CBS 480.64 TaxID=1314780 RepID=A0A6A7BXF6_9PEZI|nr:AMP-dependent synthetase and ligase [Piedraia hortae CBS 480.64]